MLDLQCPDCKESQYLATIEELSGLCMVIGIDAESQQPRYHGWTDVDWDSSTTRGVMCRGCNWESTNESWMEELHDPR